MQNTGTSTGTSIVGADPKEQGTIFLKQGRFDEAVALLREAVVLDSEDEVAWRLLGGALALKGDPDASVRAFENSVRLQPKGARSHYNLGLALQSAGKLSEARASLERALALDPGHDQARSRLGEVTQQMGQQRPSSVPSTPTSAEGHTNIGAGNTTGLASISSASFQAQNQSQSAAGEGHSNIGAGSTVGLSSIGAFRETPASSGGTTNIGGGSTVGLSSVGVSAAPPAETGHTNIGGGNTTMLGSVGTSGSGMASRTAPAPASPAPTPSIAAPSSANSAQRPASSPPSSLSPSERKSPIVSGGDLMNTSGMKGDAPDEISKSFNWGAMLFTWLDLGFIWAFNMRLNAVGGILLAMLLVPGGTGFGAIAGNAKSGGGLLGAFGFIGLAGLAKIGIGIYLGFNGNKLAWQNRTFASEDDCLSCQKTWLGWAVGICCFNAATTILVAIFLGKLVIAILSGAAGKTPLGH